MDKADLDLMRTKLFRVELEWKVEMLVLADSKEAALEAADAAKFRDYDPELMTSAYDEVESIERMRAKFGDKGKPLSFEEPEAAVLDDEFVDAPDFIADRMSEGLRRLFDGKVLTCPWCGMLGNVEDFLNTSFGSLCCPQCHEEIDWKKNAEKDERTLPLFAEEKEAS